jgi:DNA repair exonuclease SbcCD ATPase subunit
VLEHLRDPLAALRRLRRFLKSEGYFVVSLPNVAHASVRLALLQGHFQYRELGLMDRTHLRFFTHDTITQLFDEAELAIVEVHRQEAPIEVDDAPFDRDSVSEDLITELESDPDARTYQFVIKAVGLEFPGLREVQRRLHEQAFELARLERELSLASSQRQQLEAQLAEHKHALAELEHALAGISAREGEVRAALIDSHDLALRRDEELRQVGERLKDEEKQLAELWQAHEEAKKIIRAREDEVESLRRENNELRVRLGRITDSLPVRTWHLLSGMPPLRWVRGRRVAAYTAEVQHLQAKDE